LIDFRRIVHERETDNQIPSGITPEGDELFKDLFGISFEQAQDLATWEGEIGERYRLLFKYLKEEYEQSSDRRFNRDTENSSNGGDSTSDS
jgi:hypothetical protein